MGVAWDEVTAEAADNDILTKIANPNKREPLRELEEASSVRLHIPTPSPPSTVRAGREALSASRPACVVNVP